MDVIAVILLSLTDLPDFPEQVISFQLIPDFRDTIFNGFTFQEHRIFNGFLGCTFIVDFYVVDFWWISEFWGSVSSVLLRKSRILFRKWQILLRKSQILLRFPHILKILARAGPPIL